MQNSKYKSKLRLELASKSATNSPNNLIELRMWTYQLGLQEIYYNLGSEYAYVHCQRGAAVRSGTRLRQQSKADKFTSLIENKKVLSNNYVRNNKTIPYNKIQREKFEQTLYTLPMKMLISQR